MTPPRTRGWWRDHDYTRRSVLRDIEGFIGWGALTDLVESAESELEKAFLSTAFLTGGRVSEVLGLTRDMFDVDREGGVAVVRNMPRLKVFKKIGELPDGSWETESLDAVRRPFPLIIQEPLMPYLLGWLERAGSGYLFPSPRRLGRPLSRAWGYKTVVRVGERAGLDIWPHWLRSQRASQLAADYNLQVLDLVDYFTWQKADMALHYSRRGWAGLLARMRPLSLYV
ncbi:MAG: site-specific integrase [Candidatus Bathyarchaeota archaeon]